MHCSRLPFLPDCFLAAGLHDQYLCPSLAPLLHSQTLSQPGRALQSLAQNPTVCAAQAGHSCFCVHSSSAELSYLQCVEELEPASVLEKSNGRHVSGLFPLTSRLHTSVPPESWTADHIFGWLRHVVGIQVCCIIGTCPTQLVYHEELTATTPIQGLTPRIP